MPRAEPPEPWTLTLYVSGAAPHSAAAIAAIRELCSGELAGRVDLGIVDVNEAPAAALADRVLAVPTLVKSAPPPLRKLVGDLSDLGILREGLGLAPHGPALSGTTEGGAP